MSGSQPTSTDAELFARFRDEGDVQAFGELYDRFEDPLVTFASRMLGSPGHEVLHETWIRVMRHAQEWTPRASFREWLFRIANTLCLEVLRSRSMALDAAAGPAPARGDFRAQVLEAAAAFADGEVPESLEAFRQVPGRATAPLPTLPPPLALRPRNRTPLFAALAAVLLIAALFFVFVMRPQPAPSAPAPLADVPPKPPATKRVTPDDLFATFHTSMGNFKVKLFPEEAPKTVMNFVGLAEGTKEWTDPRDGGLKATPFYDGTICHRIIPAFMIQCGDPSGTGRGGPGYRFDDEFLSGRKFDRPGLLAMANAGPNTNGSQFFITVSTPTYLDNRHTIFGEVMEGYDVVERISKVPTGPGDRPKKDVRIDRIEISGAAAPR
jgi:peptidyl-prolyl cis-trans isomerase A (cyclophilin A)